MSLHYISTGDIYIVKITKLLIFFCSLGNLHYFDILLSNAIKFIAASMFKATLCHQVQVLHCVFKTIWLKSYQDKLKQFCFLAYARLFTFVAVVVENRLFKSIMSIAGFPSKVGNLTYAQNCNIASKIFANKHRFHPTSQREQNRHIMVNWH